MKTSDFDDLAVIGALAPEETALLLSEVGEETAARTNEGGARGVPRLWPWSGRPWQHTSHSLGFLPVTDERGSRRILGIGEFAADQALRGKRLKITLNALRVADYPGGGTHRVLIDFYARNQTSSGPEDLHYNATYRVRESEHAAIRGYPIFVGLNAGDDGVALHFHTVNVKNESDEAFLDFLEGDVLKSGLKLTTAMQPAIAPLSKLALAITKSIAKRNKNVSVQDCYLGLDFDGTGMGARLAVGDYIAIQTPEDELKSWDWADWVYDTSSGLVVSRDDRTQTVPYNYLAFGVSKHSGE